MTPYAIVSQAPETARLLASSTTGAPTNEALANRARGVLLGLAVGNLLGLPVE